MNRYVFARILRASGRLMLFAGAMLGLGLAAIQIYFYFYKLAHPEFAIKPVQIEIPVASGAETANTTNLFATIITTTISVIVAAALIALIAKLYNKHMRNIVVRLAKLFKAQIFTVEIVGTLIAWTLTILLMAPLIPAASIAATFAFIINEFLFIFAWGAYGQPNYKI